MLNFLIYLVPFYQVYVLITVSRMVKEKYRAKDLDGPNVKRKYKRVSIQKKNIALTITELFWISYDIKCRINRIKICLKWVLQMFMVSAIKYVMLFVFQKYDTFQSIIM